MKESPQTGSARAKRSSAKRREKHVPFKRAAHAANRRKAQKEFDRRLLSHCAPATVFLNDDLEIVHARGRVNGDLKLAPGRASLSILEMAGEGLRMDLRNARGRAKKEMVAVRKQNVQVKHRNGLGHAGQASQEGLRLVNFEVVPIRVGNSKESHFMVAFQDAAVRSAGSE